MRSFTSPSTAANGADCTSGIVVTSGGSHHGLEKVGHIDHFRMLYVRHANAIRSFVTREDEIRSLPYAAHATRLPPRPVLLSAEDEPLLYAQRKKNRSGPLRAVALT